MYKLYYMPGACSRAIHALLLDLGQPLELIPRDSVEDFRKINPSNQVPVLVDGELVLGEGVAIVLHLLEKHRSPTLPADPAARAEFYEWLLFANATLHPAYGMMFFAHYQLEGEAGKREVLEKGAARLSSLWSIIDERLQKRQFVCGDGLSVVDMMLAVYSGWGQAFPTDIQLGERTERMLAAVQQYPAFQKAVAAEEAEKAPLNA